MRHDDDTLMNPPLEDLLKRIPQKYELVLAATRRAKQIIRERRLNPTAIDSDRDRKPLSVALMDILEGRVDTKALMAADIEFDEIEDEPAELFAEVEGFPRRPDSDLPEGEFESDEELEEDEDDIEELEDIDSFGLQDGAAEDEE